MFNHVQVSLKISNDKDLRVYEIETIEIVISKFWYSRGNRFNISQMLLGLCIGQNYTLSLPLFSTQPLVTNEIRYSTQYLNLQSGLISPRTQINFLSKSNIYMYILDITSELYEFHQTELNLTRMKNFILYILTKLREEKDLSHQVNLIMFVNLRQYISPDSPPKEEDFYERILKLNITDIYRHTVFNQLYQNIKYTFMDIIRKVSYHIHETLGRDISPLFNSLINYFKDYNYVINRHMRGFHNRIFNFNGYSDYLFSRNSISDQLLEHSLIKKYHENYLKLNPSKAIDWGKHEYLLYNYVIPYFTEPHDYIKYKDRANVTDYCLRSDSINRINRDRDDIESIDNDNFLKNLNFVMEEKESKDNYKLIQLPNMKDLNYDFSLNNNDENNQSLCESLNAYYTFKEKNNPNKKYSKIVDQYNSISKKASYNSSYSNNKSIPNKRNDESSFISNYDKASNDQKACWKKLSQDKSKISRRISLKDLSGRSIKIRRSNHSVLKNEDMYFSSKETDKLVTDFKNVSAMDSLMDKLDDEAMSDYHHSMQSSFEYSPTVFSHSSKSDVLRAFNITSETHRNNNTSRTIDYTGCKTLLVTMNTGAITSDNLTNQRFQELHRVNPATYEVISLSEKPFHKTPIFINKEDGNYDSQFYIPWHYFSYYAESNFKADKYRFDGKSSTFVITKNSNIFFPTLKTDHKIVSKYNCKAQYQPNDDCLIKTRFSQMMDFDNNLFKTYSIKQHMNKVTKELYNSISNTEESYNHKVKLFNKKYKNNIINEIKPIHYYMIYNEMLLRSYNGHEWLNELNKKSIYDNISEQNTEITIVNEFINEHRQIRCASLYKKVLDTIQFTPKNTKHLFQMKYIMGELAKTNIFLYDNLLIDLEFKLFDQYDMRNVHIRAFGESRSKINRFHNQNDNFNRFCSTYIKQKTYNYSKNVTFNNKFLYFPRLRHVFMKVKWLEVENNYKLYYEYVFNINESRFENSHSYNLLETITCSMLDYHFYVINHNYSPKITQNNFFTLISSDLLELQHFCLRDSKNVQVSLYRMKPHLDEFTSKLGDRSPSHMTITNTSLSELDLDLNELDKIENYKCFNMAGTDYSKEYNINEQQYSNCLEYTIDNDNNRDTQSFKYKYYTYTDIQRCFIDREYFINIKNHVNYPELQHLIAKGIGFNEIHEVVNKKLFKFKYFTILLLNKITDREYIQFPFKSKEDFTLEDLDYIYSQTQIESLKDKFIHIKNFLDKDKFDFKLKNIFTSKIKKIYRKEQYKNSRTAKFCDNIRVNDYCNLSDESFIDMIFGDYYNSEKKTLLYLEYDANMYMFMAYKMQFFWMTDVYTKMATICEYIFKLALDNGLTMVKISSNIDFSSNFNPWAIFDMNNLSYGLYYLLNRKYSIIDKKWDEDSRTDTLISSNGFLIVKLVHREQSMRNKICFIINHQFYKVNWCSVEFYIILRDLELDLLKGMKLTDYHYIMSAYI